MEFRKKGVRNGRGQGRENKSMGLGKDTVGISLGTVGKGRLPTDCQPEV